jgi:AcrR family transcriptional regulator
MKTRDRILVTSLLLFNEEGEPNVTTVDISNEMDISPGNLYYHFKGKEAIIEALFNRFEVELSDILRAPLEKALSVEDSWFYLYVVPEPVRSAQPL